MFHSHTSLFSINERGVIALSADINTLLITNHKDVARELSLYIQNEKFREVEPSLVIYRDSGTMIEDHLSWIYDHGAYLANMGCRHIEFRTGLPDTLQELGDFPDGAVLYVIEYNDCASDVGVYILSNDNCMVSNTTGSHQILIFSEDVYFDCNQESMWPKCEAVAKQLWLPAPERFKYYMWLMHDGIYAIRDAIDPLKYGNVVTTFLSESTVDEIWKKIDW